MPLGSGALAGTAFPIDRGALARTLGFSQVSRNSIDAVSNRDFLCDYLYAGSLLLGHLSRLAADFILYSSAEFALLRMGDSVTTGSSLMPQKRNPDALELLRGKASAMEARLLSLLGLLRGLPSSYNKDLQEDKVPVFAAVEELELALPVMGLVLKDLSIDEPRMRQVAADSFLLATDMADYLVEKGVPFRSAHRLVGELVNLAISRNQALTDLPLEELRRHDEHFDQDFQAVFTVQRSLERRCAFGGTAPARVSEQLDAAADRWSARLIS
jgi:argininosuccinate lyase